MTTRAICLTPMRVQPGACLAHDVRRANGQVLLAAGTVLEQEHLANLFERGIELVYVEVEDTRDEATRARDIATAEAVVKLRFRGPSTPTRDELRDAVIAYRRQSV